MCDEITCRSVAGTQEFYKNYAESLALNLPLKYKASELQQKIGNEELEKLRHNPKAKLKNAKVTQKDFKLVGTFKNEENYIKNMFDVNNNELFSDLNKIKMISFALKDEVTQFCKNLL